MFTSDLSLLLGVLDEGLIHFGDFVFDQLGIEDLALRVEVVRQLLLA